MTALTGLVLSFLHFKGKTRSCTRDSGATSVLSGWPRKGAMGPLHLFLLLLITGGTHPLQCFLEQMAG